MGLDNFFSEKISLWVTHEKNMLSFGESIPK